MNRFTRKLEKILGVQDKSMQFMNILKCKYGGLMISSFVSTTAELV